MIGRGLLLVGLAVGLASPSDAQAVGRCEVGTAQRFVENPFLRASVFNTGALFFGGSTTSGDGFLLPKQDGTSTIFAASLWVGGKVGGEVRVAAARYGGWDFWPGSLDDPEEPPGACFQHDRIYLVSRSDIRRFYETGELTDDLRDWPVHLGAPVIDGDGTPDNYNLRAGDQPDLIGDVAAWWVMNDVGGEHGASSPDGALGVEVRVLAFTYGEPRRGPTSPALLQTLFVRYEILNRGDEPITEAYVSMYTDPDLGDPRDDYIGTDTLRHMGFVYNESDVDDAYGPAPPAQGLQVLIGPIVGEDTLGLTSTSTFIGGGPHGTEAPGTAEEYYSFMQGLWGNGTPYYEFGTGFEQAWSGAPTTRFMFPGDPVSGMAWSQVNIDGLGTPSVNARWLVASTGPFRIEPAGSQTILFSFPFARSSSNLQSILALRGIAGALLQAVREGAFVGAPVERPDLEFDLALSRIRPNPSTGTAEVSLTLPSAAHVCATVYDALGRQLEVLVDGELPEGETALALPDGLAPGAYLLRVEVPGAVETLPFTVAR